jgi:hypothetical protein
VELLFEYKFYKLVRTGGAHLNDFTETSHSRHGVNTPCHAAREFERSAFNTAKSDFPQSKCAYLQKNPAPVALNFPHPNPLSSTYATSGLAACKGSTAYLFKRISFMRAGLGQE